MEEICRLFGEHVFLALLVTWVLTSVFSQLYDLITEIFMRIIRMVTVCIRGWPKNPLMDADGDIIHSEQSKKDEGAGE